MASIRTGLIGVTVLAFVALESCSSSKNDDTQGPSRTGGSAGTVIGTTGGTSTGARGGAAGSSGGYIPPGTADCNNRGTCLHPYCTNDAALNKNCSRCAYDVCEIFPLCCTAMWDEFCMLQAQTSCGCSCGVNTGGAPAGTGGRSTGGGGGTAGTKTGGAGGVGQGGTAQAGSGGVSANGGSAGGADTGGEPAVGGAGGDMGGAPPAVGGSDTGGSGGAGGSTPTLADSCATVCNMLDAASGLSACTMPSTCVDSCTAYTDPDLFGGVVEFPPMVACLAETTASQWECSTSMGDLIFGAIPVGSTSCEDLICAWSCADLGGLLPMGDDTVAARCGC